MGAIKAIKYTTTYDWATQTADGLNPAVWTAVDDFLADGLEPGVEDIVTHEMGDGADDQDGVKFAGEFKAKGATLPAAGVRTWFQFTMKDGSKQVVGGKRGCRVGVGKASVRPLGGGPAYSRIMYSATSKVAGDLVAVDNS